MTDQRGPLRTALDTLYLIGGIIAAGFMVAILCIIVGQMVTRWAGIAFPGSTDYAGYCMAAASFLAFPYALNAGAHIRVTLVLNRLGSFRRIAEIWCMAIGTLLAIYLAWYAVQGVYTSHLINDISQGQDELPLWIPQLSMAVGSVLLAIAFVDNLVSLIISGTDNIEAEKLKDAGH
ncbi:MAG: TRAP transporter small permease [Pseudomonadota bacterium]